MTDPGKVVGDLKDAALHLREAAKALTSKSGTNSLAQALGDAVTQTVRKQPLIKNVAEAAAEKFGGDAEQPSKRNPWAEVLNDMNRRLTARDTGRKPSPRSNPTKPLRGRVTRAIGSTLLRGATRYAGRTRAGRMALGLATRAAATMGARGVTAGAGAAAAGAGAAGLGASVVTGVGIVVGALALIAAALYGFGKAIDSATESQLEAMRKYEKVAPAIAVGFMQADLQDILRNMERGEKLAPSAQSLINANQKLKDNSTEIVVLLESIQNMVLSILESGLADLIGPLSEMAAGVNEWLRDKGLLGPEQKFEAFDQFLDRVAKDTEKAMQAGDRWHEAARNDRRK